MHILLIVIAFPAFVFAPPACTKLLRKGLGPNGVAELILRCWINYRMGVKKKIELTGMLQTLEELSAGAGK